MRTRASDFADVYDENVFRVYGYFAYRLGRRADAEDLTQLTFERALRAWHRFDEGKATVGTWLLAIARNLLIDHLRQEGSRPSTSLEGRGGHAEMVAPSNDPSSDLGFDPELAAALAQLRDREREILALRFGWDLTAAQIADSLGLSLANVQQILSRTLRGLRAELSGSELSRRR